MRIFSKLLCVLVLVYCTAFGADLAGVWMGEAPGRNGEKQDIAFLFKVVKGTLSGVLLGEEFDLPVEDLKLDGEKISFTVTTTNYYSGSRQTMNYTGTASPKEIVLTRQRKDAPDKVPVDPPAADRRGGKQVVTLKRIT